MSIGPQGYSPEDKLKLYLIARAEAVFGPGTVARILTDKDGVKLYMIAPGHSAEEMKLSMKSCFSRKLFQDKAAPDRVTLTYTSHVGQGEADEQMGWIVFAGDVAEIAKNVEAKNPALFAACLENKAAQEVLRRQPGLGKGMEGIIR